MRLSSEWQTAMVFCIAVGVISCVFILIAGCTTTTPVNETNDTRYTTPDYVAVNWEGDSGITRFVDTDADVMCWYVDSADDGGLSCLSCSDVRGCYT